jgi:hypothetical protein
MSETANQSHIVDSFLDLSWSCRTIGSSDQLFDLIIFHEHNEFIQQMDCPSNVIKINLGSNGIASLISAALLKDSGTHNGKVLKLKENIPIVLKKFPYFLAEFKTGVCQFFSVPIFIDD